MDDAGDDGAVSGSMVGGDGGLRLLPVEKPFISIRLHGPPQLEKECRSLAGQRALSGNKGDFDWDQNFLFPFREDMATMCMVEVSVYGFVQQKTQLQQQQSAEKSQRERTETSSVGSLGSMSRRRGESGRDKSTAPVAHICTDGSGHSAGGGVERERVESKGSSMHHHHAPTRNTTELLAHVMLPLCALRPGFRVIPLLPRGKYSGEPLAEAGEEGENDPDGLTSKQGSERKRLSKRDGAKLGTDEDAVTAAVAADLPKQRKKSGRRSATAPQGGGGELASGVGGGSAGGSLVGGGGQVEEPLLSGNTSAQQLNGDRSQGASRGQGAALDEPTLFVRVEFERAILPPSALLLLGSIEHAALRRIITHGAHLDTQSGAAGRLNAGVVHTTSRPVTDKQQRSRRRFLPVGRC